MLLGKGGGGGGGRQELDSTTKLHRLYTEPTGGDGALKLEARRGGDPEETAWLRGWRRSGVVVVVLVLGWKEDGGTASRRRAKEPTLAQRRRGVGGGIYAE